MLAGFDVLIQWHDCLDSTQDEARRQFESGLIQTPTVIVAREQTHGRGTKGRVWQSEKDGGVYFTLVLPGDAVGGAGWRATSGYTHAVALACFEALKQLYGLELRIKPINDLMVEGRKLGGILLESVSQGHAQGGLSVLYVGVGINWEPLRLPEYSGYQAISLSEVLTPEQIQSVSRQALVTHLAQAIQRQCEALHHGPDGERCLEASLEPLWVESASC